MFQLKAGSWKAQALILAKRRRQRLAGWTCVLSYAWALAAPLAHAGRVLPLEGTGRYSQRDALNRPETITQGEQMTRYGYDLAGRAVMLIGGNGQVTENTYDDAGRLINRVLFRSLMQRADGGVMAEFGWAHDAVGNVVAQHEVWPGSVDRAAGVRVTTMTYDGANRLETETITDPEQGVTATSYVYDDANNRDTKTVTGGSEPGFWDYTYNDANQLTAWEKRSSPAGTLIKSATLGYDDNGNRTSQTVTEVATTTTSVTAYHWDAQDRLSAVVMPDASVHSYDYDYRTRRTGTHETTATTAKHTTIVFAGGLSLAEWEQSGTGLQPVGSVPPTVEYTRGPDMGGGVGGLLYSARGGEAGPSAAVLKYNLSNGRGDVVAQSDSTGTLTWTASYEAYGKRTKETGTNADKQRANTKDEDPTGLLNEGFRYRDIETGVWLSRDPAGFVDGPNLYAYVRQNPWTAFDPDGLKAKVYVHDPAEYKRVKKLEGKGIYQGAKIEKGFRTKSNGSVVKWRPTGVIAESNGEGGFHLYDIQQNYNSASWVFDNKEHAGTIKFWHDYLSLASAMTGFSGLGRGSLGNMPKAPAGGLRPPVSKPSGNVSPVSTAIDDAAQAEQQVARDVPTHPEGSFSVADWSGYPSHVPKPQGPFRLLEGAEYDTARKAANGANRAAHAADPSLKGLQLHEVQPVKFGGSPVDPGNKVPLTPQQHAPVTNWWNSLQRSIQNLNGG